MTEKLDPEAKAIAQALGGRWARRLARSPRALIRMFGSRGNPQARNLFSVQVGLQLHVTTGPV
jgi:hypothetical protein